MSMGFEFVRFEIDFADAGKNDVDKALEIG